MAAPLLKRRFTVEEYQKLGKVGILGEDDRVELIEGEIIQISPIGSRHASAVGRLTHLLTKLLGERCIVWVQNPVRLDDHTECQPDIVVLRPRKDFYESRTPGPQDVLFLIEVADTSEGYDRKQKVALYARHDIPETWLVLLNRNLIGIHRSPSARKYKDVMRLSPGKSMAPLAFPDIPIPADAILPPGK